MNNDEFQTLGLTSLQTEIIYGILELGGEASAPDIIDLISKNHKVNRTSIYSVLSKLQQIGIIMSNDERSSNYALISTSIDDLVGFITKPHKDEVKKFEEKLHQAKARQKRSPEFEIHYLKTKQQIITQLDLILDESSPYYLIMANAPVLQNIYDQIQQLYSMNKTILIIPTWNPVQKLNFDEIINKYRILLSENNVSNPMEIFDRFVPMMQSVFKKLPTELINLNRYTNFIQVLTQTQWLTATYLESEISMGSGIYSREPMISQMMHLLFLSIFETNANAVKTIIDHVLRSKIENTMQFLQKNFT